MKTLLFPLVLVCTCLSLRAQSTKHASEQVITYDYAARVYVKYETVTRNYRAIQKPCLRQGTDVTFEIININPFAQKVVISGVPVSMTTQMPAQLASLFNIKAEAEKELTNTKEQVDEMKDVQRSTTNAGLRAAMDTLVSSCTAYYDEARNINDALALQKQLVDIMADKSFYNDGIMKQALQARGIDAARIRQLKTDYDKFEKAYDNVLKQYQAAADSARKANDPDKQARILNALNQVDKNYQALEVQYEETLANIDNLLAKATDSGSYVVRSLPMVLDGRASDADEVEFDVQIDDKKFPVPVTFRVGGGVKVDYSVGPVANFIADRQYYFDTEGRLQQLTEGRLLERLTPSVAPMMHVYRRSCESLAIGGMFGVNANFKELTDVNLGFLVGVSAVVGRPQKVFVSTGVSFAKVNRLKAGQYETGNIYEDVKIEDVTQQVLRPAWFLAISFSLTKRNILTP